MKGKILIFSLLAFVMFACGNHKEQAAKELNAAHKALYESDTAAARLHYREALRFDPSNPEAFLGLARLKLNQLDYSRAMELVDKALKFSPEYGEAYRTKAQIYFMKGDKKRSCENFKLAKKYGVKNLDNQLRYCR